MQSSTTLQVLTTIRAQHADDVRLATLIKDPVTGRTRGQVAAVNIALQAALQDRHNRFPVLRKMLGYDDNFSSTKQLMWADAHAILSIAYGGEGVQPTPSEEFIQLVRSIEADL